MKLSNKTKKSLIQNLVINSDEYNDAIKKNEEIKVLNDLIDNF